MNTEQIRRYLESVSEYENFAIGGFGMAAGINFLIMGALYIGLTYNYSGKGLNCDKELAKFGYVTGALFILGALLAFSMEASPTIPMFGFKVPMPAFFLAIVSVAMLGVKIWGLYLMLRNEGIACRAGGSELWMALMVITIIATAGFGKITL